MEIDLSLAKLVHSRLLGWAPLSVNKANLILLIANAGGRGKHIFPAMEIISITRYKMLLVFNLKTPIFEFNVDRKQKSAK